MDDQVTTGIVEQHYESVPLEPEALLEPTGRQLRAKMDYAAARVRRLILDATNGTRINPDDLEGVLGLLS